jgi:hypothetical protein
MKRIVIVMWATLTSVGLAWGAVTAYTMMLNKDKNLCPAMLELVNEDLKKDRFINYPSHEEFTAITWEPLGPVWGPNYEDSFCSKNSMARFDFNNDGRTDIVVKLSGCFKGALMDSLFLFDGDDPAFASIRNNEDVLAKSKGRFPLDTEILDSYIVKGLPPIKLQSGGMSHQGIAGWMVLNPFLYRGTYYLAATDNTERGIVIGKYKGPGELDDICYFASEKEKVSQEKALKKGQR